MRGLARPWNAKACALCGGDGHLAKDCGWKKGAALAAGMRGRAPEDYETESSEPIDEVRHLFPCLPTNDE
jgi:hypothetical protein